MGGACVLGGDEKCVQKLLEKSEQKKLLGRSTRRRKDNIKMGHME
jgi:hypothetical protein